MKENERERRGCIYIKGGNIIIITHHHFPPKSVAFARSQGCVLGQNGAKRGSFKAASREKRKEAAFQRKRTKHGGFDLS